MTRPADRTTPLGSSGDSGPLGPFGPDGTVRHGPHVPDKPGPDGPRPGGPGGLNGPPAVVRAELLAVRRAVEEARLHLHSLRAHPVSTRLTGRLEADVRRIVEDLEDLELDESPAASGATSTPTNISTGGVTSSTAASPALPGVGPPAVPGVGSPAASGARGLPGVSGVSDGGRPPSRPGPPTMDPTTMDPTASDPVLAVPSRFDGPGFSPGCDDEGLGGGWQPPHTPPRRRRRA